MSAALAIQTWPSLRDAVQPRPLERVSGSWSFNVEAEWRALAERVARGEFRLRAPAPSTRGLCGPLHAIGTCLEPLKRDGDLMWIDPALEAEDGDLVVVSWGAEARTKIAERIARNPALTAVYGRDPVTIGTKVLRRFGNRYALVCNDGISYLDGNRILGVARYMERRSVALYGSGSIGVSAIGQNAATEVYKIEAAGTSIADPVETDVSITVTEDVIIHVEAMCNSMVASGDLLWEAYVGGTDGPTSQLPSGTQFPVLVHSFEVSAGTYDVGTRLDSVSAGNVNINDQMITITVIKR